jgi:putative transposase
MTGYSPSAGYGSFPVEGLKSTKKILKKIDQLNSHLAIIKPLNREQLREKEMGRNAKRNRMRAIHRCWRKIKNIRHHMHYTLANTLLDDFQHILLPSFGTSKMVNREDRVIGKKTARDMLTWGHYEFQQRLLWKAKTRGRERSVHIVSEQHTTMTCGSCGLYDRNVGSKKTYECRKCGLVVDRDLNAARNILIRNMGICSFVLKEDPIDSFRDERKY